MDHYELEPRSMESMVVEFMECGVPRHVFRDEHIPALSRCTVSPVHRVRTTRNRSNLEHRCPSSIGSTVLQGTIIHSAYLTTHIACGRC